MRIVWIALIVFSSLSLFGKDIHGSKNDSLKVAGVKKDPDLFYDSLQVKASRHPLTKWLFCHMVRTTKDTTSAKLLSYEYYRCFEHKTIGSITIKPLDVFGPDLNDTTKVTDFWIEKVANKLHSKSNPYVIRKNLWFDEGDPLDPNLFMDNERLLRTLPYLKDVKIVVKTRPWAEDMVDVLVLTKDVFSFGLTGELGDINKGDVGVYDKNILGIGHEVGARIVAHTDRMPHVGFETYYSVNNIKGNFINFAAGYANTYIRQGFYVSFDRDFLRPQSVYAGGLTVIRSYRSDQITLEDNVISAFPLNYLFLDGWYGRRLKLGIKPNDSRFQMTLSGRIRNIAFYNRHADASGNLYFANSTMYLAGLSFSERSYVRDRLIYSYGITEDIPKGYLHELVMGYDNNEFGNRWYSHLFLSSGNLFDHKPVYFYSSLGVGSFWNAHGFEQGMADLKLNFISPLFNIWCVQARQFIKMNYTVGINRTDEEALFLKNSAGIRGFGSLIGKGKQRLTLNIENVFFQKKSILNFQSALFSFIDLGLIGDTGHSIFKENYYAGVGIGLRIRNENLIFKTVQLRLAYYPNHPRDVSAIGFVLDEVSKSRFYSFQPRGPEPLKFE